MQKHWPISRGILSDRIDTGKLIDTRTHPPMKCLCGWTTSSGQQMFKHVLDWSPARVQLRHRNRQGERFSNVIPRHPLRAEHSVLSPMNERLKCDGCGWYGIVERGTREVLARQHRDDALRKACGI